MHHISIENDSTEKIISANCRSFFGQEKLLLGNYSFLQLKLFKTSGMIAEYISKID
jgi:hypothetical protein